MSTVLINTNGKSTFQEGSSIANFGVDNEAIKRLGLELTDIDSKPILVPTRKVIDVVNDFSWYAGPKATPAALDRVPCCFLTEREQLLSSLISGSIYYLNAGGQFGKNTINSKFVQGLLGKATAAIDNKDSAAVSLGKAVQTTIRAAVDSLQAIAGSEEDKGLLKQHNLKSLDGIYYTKPTDFNYRLPLFESPGSPLSEGYNENASGQIGELASKVIDKITDISEILGKGVNFAQPGVYIEKPQYFQGAGYRTETIKFPLSNTIRRGTVSPIQQNYELLWLLAFQNRPYKTTFARTPPPKIYTVNVPGQFSMPYAYISDMSVAFKGTVRQTTVSVPSGNGSGPITSKRVKTNVPEAYEVSLSFTSLLGEYGNTMISEAATVGIDGNRVSVGNAPKAEVVGPPIATR
jgi:hypothetical protein